MVELVTTPVHFRHPIHLIFNVPHSRHITLLTVADMFKWLQLNKEMYSELTAAGSVS